ncbi:MAG TPA: GNAT family N-acetyltransferase [Anaerolineales bacterium]|nr:GNAT family N-acetyltransferase [Anaerolineales bacterium]
MDITFRKRIEPTTDVLEHPSRWENDPTLIHLIRPNRNKEAFEMREVLTVQDLEERLVHNHTFLIYLGNQLIGEMDYQIEPKHLYKNETGTAWIGIIVGEETGSGKGIGSRALKYLEEEIKQQSLKRIELGVFEFNPTAFRLYQKAGYTEIARIPNFTYWQGKMWQDIRMEKYI